jgi:hypothetical protein
MHTSFTFWLVVLAVLFAFLFVSVWLRQRAMLLAEEARLRAVEKEFPPRAFDSSTIAPQIDRVRQDYAASLHQRWRPASYRSEFIAAARRLVTRLEYFRRMTLEHEMRKHGA